MKAPNSYLIKLLYAAVAVFLLAAFALQVLQSTGALASTLPPGVPTVVSLAALLLALGVLLRRLWLIDALLTRGTRQHPTSIFPTHPFDEVGRLEETERARNERVSRISHELRTPMTSINGFAELLMGDESLSGEAREFAGIIHAEAQRLSVMINAVVADVQLAEAVPPDPE